MGKRRNGILKNSLVILLFLCIATGVGLLFRRWNFPEANIVLGYFMFVVISSRFTDGYVYGIIAAAGATSAFNYFFTAPYFSFSVYDPVYFFTFGVLSISSVITASLTIRAAESEREALEKEKETEVLYRLTGKLNEAETMEEAVVVSLEIIGDFFATDTAVLLVPPAGEEFRIRSYEEKTIRKVKSLIIRKTLLSPDTKERKMEGKEDRFGTFFFPQNPTAVPEDKEGLFRAMVEHTALAMDRLHSVEEKQRSDRQAEKERFRSNLLRSVSHDLRTPVASISGSCEMLKDLLEPGSLSRDIVQGMISDAGHLKTMMENILSLTRLENDRLIGETEEEAVEEVVAVAIGLVEKKFPEHRIDVSIPEDLLLLPMDGRLIEQVLVNLLDNACKFSSKNDKIELIVGKEEDFVEFSVKDRGRGILPEDLPHVFELFYTKGKSSADGSRGVGLGLAISYSIIKAHGGELKAVPREGGGTIFQFTLPRERRPHG